MSSQWPLGWLFSMFDVPIHLHNQNLQIIWVHNLKHIHATIVHDYQWHPHCGIPGGKSELDFL
jgi:hypothetical protein